MSEQLVLSTVRELARELKGSVVLPGHGDYASNCSIFNKGVHLQPAIFVKVANTRDIRLALAFAQQERLQVSVKGGGHASCGSCLVNNGLVIDTRAMNQVSVSVADKRVSVAAGALNHEVDSAARKYQLAMPIGTCPSVGVIGSTLGGGLGFLSRKHGLSCDNVEQMTMTTAAGETIEIDAEQHTELFWALRGAGNNQFGVISSARYRLHDIPKTIYGGILSWPLKYAKAILQRYRDLMDAAEDELFIYAYIPSAPKSNSRICLFGGYFADGEKGKALFESIASWQPSCEMDLAQRPYWDLQETEHEENLAVYWKQGMLDSPLSDDLIDAILHCYKRCPDNGGGIMLDPLGGLIKRIEKSSTAFIHRDARYICSITGLNPGSTVSPSINEWVRESYRELQPYMNGHAYQNFEDRELDEARCYYGEHVQRLQALKQRYDPENLFVGNLFSS